jgi:hypothetical protein
VIIRKLAAIYKNRKLKHKTEAIINILVDTIERKEEIATEVNRAMKHCDAKNWIDYSCEYIANI